MSGRRVGPYEILSTLGAGGMGEVFRARDTRLGRDVAVKLVANDRARDPDRLRRFEQEARAVAALSHPNILALHDVGSENGLSYVVFELLEGETLGRRLRRGAVPVRQAVDYGIQLCRGLAAAHDQGIVHRDLKPDNLFLTAAGPVKILDFGLAKLTDPPKDAGATAQKDRTTTDPGLAIGTIGYMSPEQVRGRPVDARSDIFSVGAILYEMLEGRGAFAAETPVDSLSAILSRDPPEIRSGSEAVPPALDRVVRRCLHKDPRERFQSVRDLAFGLEMAVGALPRASLSVDDRSRRWGWARPVAASIALLAAILAAFLWVKSGTTPLPGYRQLTFERGMVLDARFTSDGGTVVYSALWNGNPAETFSMRLDRPEAQPVSLPASRIWGVSRQSELAIVLGRPGEREYRWAGALARVPLSGGVPREVADNVWAADWSPDGRELAAVRLVEGAFQLEYPLGRVLVRPLAPLRDEGFAFRVSPRGDRIAIVSDDGITVIDSAGKATTLRGLQTDENVEGLAWDPSGDAIWTAGTKTSYGSTGIWRIGLDGRAREMGRLPGPAYLHDVAADGRVLIHQGFERNGLRARGPGEAAEHDVAVNNWNAETSITDDGRQLLLYDVAEPPLGWAFLRPTAGGPPVRIGEGSPLGISPDGKWVLIDRGTVKAPQVVLTPTGSGATRALSTEGLQKVHRGGWFMDATHVLLDGEEADRPGRTFRLDLAGGRPVPVTPERTTAVVGTVANGAVIGVARDGSLVRCPLDGSQPSPLGLRIPDRTIAIRASADRRFLFLGEWDVPGHLDRFELATGRRIPWKTLQPDDPAGFVAVYGITVTPDGSAYAYRYLRFLQDLYVFGGPPQRGATRDPLG
jgi:eukaryotic-like serine/threonine-protein kinase